MFIVNSRKQTEHIEKYKVEGSSNNPPILFKQLKTLCYIGDKKVKGGNVMHISTTIIDDKTFELFHNFSKDMLHVNIVFSSGKNYLVNFYLPKKINGLYTDILYCKRGSGVDLLSENKTNNSKILFDYSNRIYIFVKRNSDLRLTEYVEFGEKKGLIY
jgi:hypothetical protein